MNNAIFKSFLLQNLNYKPTKEQDFAIDKLTQFLFDNNAFSAFILKGYAGTGKTSLVGAFVETVEKMGGKCVLMAPTGRAAKVMARYSQHQAFTVHKVIFRQKRFGMELDFALGFNSRNNVIFVVDEASMISDSEDERNAHDSLLASLMAFVYGNGRGCRLLFVGDDAQLPPIGETESPALRAHVMKKFGVDVGTAMLTEVVRQDEMSGILWNSTNIRKMMDKGDFNILPKIRFKGFADVMNITGDILIETLTDCYQHDGMDETIVVCRSNKRANIYNNGIRAQILWRESLLESQDLVMVAKNNYYWTEQNMTEENNMEENMEGMDFIANGEVAVVRRVRNVRELYGFSFADCTLSFPDYDDAEIDATLLLDALQSQAPALTQEQQEKLFKRVEEDYLDIPLKADRMKKIKQDPYFNALQVKYAYAVTCHKAQGGQWTNVFIDQGYLPQDTAGKDYYRWIYTAMTRATRRLFFVNWKDEQTDI